MTRQLLTAALLSLTACTDLGPEYESNLNLLTPGNTTSSITTSSTETTTTPTTSTDTTTTETSTFSPMSGTWDNTEISLEKNGCGLDSKALEPLNIYLNTVDASSFLLQSVDEELFWECASSGSATYECTSYLLALPSKGWDAVLNYVYTPELQFYSEVSATMLVDFNIECVGADCAYLSDLNGWSYPCLTELNLTLEHAGP